MKLCDRCTVPGCCLTYLGTACKNAREEYCPDTKPNRAELLCNMTLREMATELLPIFEELCEDGVPSREYFEGWLKGEPEGEAL